MQARVGLGQQTFVQAAVLGVSGVCVAITGRRLHRTFLARHRLRHHVVCVVITLVPLALIVDRPWTPSPSLRSLLAATAAGV